MSSLTLEVASSSSDAAPRVEWIEYGRRSTSASGARRLNVLRGPTAMTGWDPDDRPHRKFVKSDEEIELI